MSQFYETSTFSSFGRNNCDGADSIFAEIPVREHLAETSRGSEQSFSLACATIEQMNFNPNKV